MRKFLIIAAVAAALVFSACEQQTVSSATDPDVSRAVSGVTQPTAWVPFSPLPFTSIPNIMSVATLTTDGVNMVAAGYDRPNSLPYVSFYIGTAPQPSWTTPVTVPSSFSVNPGTAHYLNGNYLVTGGSTSTTGIYSYNGTRWSKTGYIGFGTKAGIYTNEAEGLYDVAGQDGKAAYARSLDSAFTTIPQTVTGWSGTGPTAYINAGAYTNGVYVCCGGSGRIAYTTSITSTTSWPTPTTTPFTNTAFINFIAYGAGTFVAVGNDASNQGFIAYSTNSGATWAFADTTYAPDITNATIYALAYGGTTRKYFAAINDDGDAAYSDDGITWTAATDSAFTTASTVVNVAVYASGDTFYAAGENAGTVQIGVTR